MKCAIVYLSMTGNTETIAMGVRDGICLLYTSPSPRDTR